jgi:Lon-like ATP-dependent protease
MIKTMGTESQDKAKKEKSQGELPPVEEWMKGIDFNTTAEIKVPDKLLEQVIGQDSAVQVIRKAAEQKRHLLLIGEPGTGKSMLAQSMTAFLPKEQLEDILVYHNQEDMNAPKVKTVPAGKGKDIVSKHKQEVMQKRQSKTSVAMILAIIIVALSIAFAIVKDPITGAIKIEIIPVLLGIFLAVFLMFLMTYAGRKQEGALIPKLLITHDEKDVPPFIDGTGAHAGALLGDIRHDPFQSGGLETPAHERVEPGAIHKAHKGVLFIDEINLLHIESQQALLTAMQEKKFQITGQSERSSGAMVRTEPVPCDFVLVAAGNLDALQGMHPALRSRVKGSGYELYMQTTMDDTEANRRRLIRFVAQEIKNDKKIPHFTKAAVEEIVKEAQRRASTRGKLTLRLRELGGLVRVAGDIAHEDGSQFVLAKHVIEAKKLSKSLEQQVAERAIAKNKEYHTTINRGAQIGVVNGLAVVQSPDITLGEMSGLVLPIAAEVTPALSREEGKIIATGRLGEIAKEAVQNVSALIKKYTGEDISKYDVHIQFIGVGEGVEGDSASVSVATAVVSALEGIPVEQDIAMTGSLSVRGDVLPVGGVTAKIEAAAEAGIKRVIIPKANMKDVMLESRYAGMVEVIPVEMMKDVLEVALVGNKKKGLLERITTLLPQRDVISIEKPSPN